MNSTELVTLDMWDADGMKRAIVKTLQANSDRLKQSLGKPSILGWLAQNRKVRLRIKGSSSRVKLARV